MAWIRDSDRKVPVLCTGNELPTIFKRNSDSIECLRCFPPRASDLQTLFQGKDVSLLLKECQYDVRRMMHRMQYGESYVIPKYSAPPTGLAIEKMFVMRQKMFGLPDPLHEYRGDIQDTERS
jgi:hypothetical protein